MANYNTCWNTFQNIAKKIIPVNYCKKRLI